MGRHILNVFFLMVNLFQNMKIAEKVLKKVSVLKTHIIILNLNILFTSSPNFIIILLYWFSWKQTIDNIFIKIINRFKALVDMYLFLFPQAPVWLGMAQVTVVCLISPLGVL